jgi:hypothetical protein
MSKTMEEIRRKLLELDSRKSKSSSNDKGTYAHWNTPVGGTSVLRFLQDSNPDNAFFWVEKTVIKLPFAGIRGHDEHKQIFVQVPCMEMFDGYGSCPITTEINPMWKDDSLKPIAKKYWRKKSYLMHGFVQADGTKEEETPENPIRKFLVTGSLFPIIKAGLLDPEMKNAPTDYLNGSNFNVLKTRKGDYDDYSTSKWARSESSLNEAQLAAIEQYSIPDLASYLPKRPTPEQLGKIFEMFESSLDGELYDPERFAKYYKPFGFDSGTDKESETDSYVPSKVSVPVTRTVQEPKVETVVSAPLVAQVEETATLVAPATSSTGKTPQEILAMIRARNSQ